MENPNPLFNNPPHPGIGLVIKAYEDGVAWAKGLKVGDRFLGALPEAESRYGKADPRTRVFLNGALDVLEHKIVCTSADGGDTLTRYEDAHGRVPIYREGIQT